MQLEQMNVAQITYDNWGEDRFDGPCDHSLALKHATFQHKGACEFIFAIGTNQQEWLEWCTTYQQLGFSSRFLEVIQQAQFAGYNYLNFYS